MKEIMKEEYFSLIDYYEDVALTQLASQISFIRKEVFKTSRKNFAAMINDFFGQHVVDWHSFQTWENGIAFPRYYVLIMLKVFFNHHGYDVLIDNFYTPRDTNINLSRSVRQIDKKSLPIYRGSIIYLEIEKHVYKAALLSVVEDKIIFADGSELSYDDIKKPIVIKEDSGCVKDITQLRYEGAPILNLSDAKNSSSVWIEIFPNIDNINNVKKGSGFYKYNECLEAFCNDDYSIILPALSYGKSYIACKDPVL